MASTPKRAMLKPVLLLPDKAGQFIARLSSTRLGRELSGAVTDDFLELLLRGMDLAFCLSRGYRRNIEDFEGTYVFRTAKDEVAMSAVFADRNMHVSGRAVEDWDLRVTFKNPAALISFLLSKNQDILNSILANEVTTDGNLNYLYKFGFMARDLTRRLGIPYAHSTPSS